MAVIPTFADSEAFDRDFGLGAPSGFSAGRIGFDGAGDACDRAFLLAVGGTPIGSARTVAHSFPNRNPHAAATRPSAAATHRKGHPHG